MSSALNSLRICFLQVISVSSHGGTQEGQSSNYFSPWTAKKKLYINSLSCPENPVIPQQPFTAPALRFPAARAEALQRRVSISQVRPVSAHSPLQNKARVTQVTATPDTEAFSQRTQLPWFFPSLKTDLQECFKATPRFWVPTAWCRCACRGESRFTLSQCHFEGKVSCKDKKTAPAKAEEACFEKPNPKIHLDTWL